MSEEESTDLSEWFERFWLAYREYTKSPFPQKWGAGSKGDAKQYVLTRLRPGEPMRKRIMDAVQAQRNYRIKLYERCGSAERYLSWTERHRDPLHANRQAKTWLHQRGWEDEIPSLSHEERKPDAALCNCGRPVTISHTQTCASCYPVDSLTHAHIVRMAEKVTRKYPDRDERIAKCREFLKKLNVPVPVYEPGAEG